MDASLFAQGAVLGFTIAAAVGPIALLTIRRTLTYGWPSGVASGLGVATADGLYAAIAAFGLTALSEPLVSLAVPLGVAGGAALVILGLRTATTAAAAADATPASTPGGLLGAYLSILGLTLANPMTILMFTAIVLSIGVSGSTVDAVLLTLGFFAGSLAWWLLLVATVSALRTRLSPRVLLAVTRVSGLLIAAFGVVSVLAALGR